MNPCAGRGSPARAMAEGSICKREHTVTAPHPARSSRRKCVSMTARRLPTEDERKRSDKDGRFWCQCHACQRWFMHRDNHVRSCGSLLNPPVSHCLLADNTGKRWWPEGKPLPDLIARGWWSRNVPSCETTWRRRSGDPWQRVATARGTGVARGCIRPGRERAREAESGHERARACTSRALHTREVPGSIPGAPINARPVRTRPRGALC